MVIFSVGQLSGEDSFTYLASVTRQSTIPSFNAVFTGWRFFLAAVVFPLRLLVGCCATAAAIAAPVVAADVKVNS